MQNENLKKNIEAVLFWKGEPTKINELVKIFGLKESEIREIITELQTELKDRSGLQINLTDSEVALVTNSESSEIIQKLQKEELDKDLSKSAVETLAIIIYRGPIRKSEIDYIRGVNSQFILRNLQIRGLIERINNLYQVSMELLNHLGISSIKEIDNYDKVNQDIQAYIDSHNAEETQ